MFENILPLTDRETDKQTDRQTDRQTDTHTHTHTHTRTHTHAHTHTHTQNTNVKYRVFLQINIYRCRKKNSTMNVHLLRHLPHCEYGDQFGATPYFGSKTSMDSLRN